MEATVRTCGRGIENFPARRCGCVMQQDFPESFIAKLFEELCQKWRGGCKQSVAIFLAKIARLICLFFGAEERRKVFMMIPNRPFWIWRKGWR